MILSDVDIQGALAHGFLDVHPLDVSQIQPASIDLKLSDKFRMFNKHAYGFIDPLQEQKNLTREVEIPKGESFVIHPGQFVLGSTAERVRLSDNIAGMVEGISSLGRLGLVVHATAGFIDPGFEGNITLEMTNVAGLPIILTPGMRVGQLVVLYLNRRALKAYGHPSLNSKYQNQVGPTDSKSWKDQDV